MTDNKEIEIERSDTILKKKTVYLYRALKQHIRMVFCGMFILNR